LRVWLSILQRDCISKKSSLWAINISHQVIAVSEKRRVAIHPFSKDLRGNFCAQNSIWRLAINPTARLPFNVFFVSVINISLRVIEDAEKEGKPIAIQTFSRELREYLYA
jgi:hypothetical protein